MDLLWDDRRTRQFVTNVGLVTSNGPNGHDIMACEWTHHISYGPALIMVNIHAENATAENITATKEFGVSLAAENQNIASSVAGGNSGHEVNKIAALKELGFEFYKAKKIDVMMPKGAAMNAECKLVKQEQLGDHIMFVGEIVEISGDENIKPVLYHNGKYWKLGENVQKPQAEVLEKIRKVVGKHKKK